MKKSMIFIVAFLAATLSLSASADPRFGNFATAGSIGGVATQTIGGSQAMNSGIAGTTVNAGGSEIGGAGSYAGHGMVVTGQGGAANTYGTSISGALGNAGAGNDFGSSAGNLNNAYGTSSVPGHSYY
jgi:hypothetical protein